ncbi:phosphotransferase [Methylomicrobium sp. Wu6]|uniref:phosphotransferase n=1 Tax=Methylomicrobium sp. Wu6 TaxID=3107928 RepID=UPI002DD62775|nr:phosphotransferase [Methylomicrobium sp. Wu6]MEC4748371.1 phosphotransferase [Methylomicrobium sp. Wu6]
MQYASADSHSDILVNRLHDFTVPWAQRIVEPHCRNTRVKSLNIVSADIGTTTRVRLTVEHDGPKSLPRSWFVKIPSLAWRARLITALPRLLHVETRFYRDIAHAVPLNRPALLAAQSRLGKGATLVLSDVAESGALPGRTGEALSLSQATAVIEHLARFHASFWGIQHDPNYRWLGGPIRQLEDTLGTLMAVPLMRLGLKKAYDAVPGHLHKPALDYARRRRRIMQFLHNGRHTLIHRDCHPGNFFWNGSQPGLLDWQLVRIGEGIADIAYFLATALEPELRREHERSLLEHYRYTLTAHGITDVTPEMLWQRYRAHLSYPFEAMVVTLAVGDMMEEEANIEMIRRAASAISDLEGFAALADA